MRRLRQDRLSRRDPQQAPLGRGRAALGRRMRRAGGLDRRRRAAAAQGARRRSSRADRAQGNFVIVCTNALLLEKKIDQFKPSPYFTWSIHLDGDQEMHDRSVCQQGVYDRAVAAIKLAKAKGFRVTINCTFFNDADPERVANFFDAVTALGVDGITVSPGYAYERAPDQQHFLNRTRDQGTVPRRVPPRPGGKAWPFTQSGLFIDFLAGNQDLSLHALGQSDAHGVWLAAALLSARRRLRQDLQGADGGDRLGRLRHRQLREMRRLHGALRLRGDRRHRHGQAPVEGGVGRAHGRADRWARWRRTSRSTISGRRNTCSHATSPRSSQRSGRPRPGPRRSRQRPRARKLVRASLRETRQRRQSAPGGAPAEQHRASGRCRRRAERVSDQRRQRALGRVADDPQRGEQQPVPRGERSGHMRFHVDRYGAGRLRSAALAAAFRSGRRRRKIGAPDL